MTTIAGAAAMLGALAWITKFVVIWARGGSDGIEDVVGGMFAFGTIALAVAIVLATASATAGRRTWIRVGLALVALLALFVVNGAVEETTRALVAAEDDSAAEELSLVIIGIPVLAWAAMRLRGPRAA